MCPTWSCGVILLLWEWVFSVWHTSPPPKLWGTPPLRSTAPLLTVILCQHSHLQFVATLSFRLPSFAKHFQKDLFLQFHQRWHKKEQLRSCIVTTWDALVWEPIWSLPYKMDLPLFSLWLWVVFASPDSLRSPDGLIKLRQVWCSVHDDGIKNAHWYMFNIPVGKWQIQGTFVFRFHVSCL